MAAAEARTAWQRAAHRYFVQEDAKRAPKLACCQSSASSPIQIDSGLTYTPDELDRPALGFVPSYRRPAFSSLTPDAKWWLHTQPNYGLQRALNLEHFQANVKSSNSSVPTVNSDSQIGEISRKSEESLVGVDNEDLGSFLNVKKCHDSKIQEMDFIDNKVDQDFIDIIRKRFSEDLGSFLNVKKCHDSKIQEMDIIDNKVDQDFIDINNMTDYYESMEMEMIGAGKSLPNVDSSWIGEQRLPWWQVTDKDELASFVAQKSLHHVENCDLPPPQKMLRVRETFKKAKYVDYDEIFLSSTEWEAQSGAISATSSGITCTKRLSSMREGYLPKEDFTTNSSSDMPGRGRVTVSEPCKAKILEALCHSQARARKAENAAKQAYSEKEHLLKLFCKQASQLFAYKQWLKLLQLENFLLRHNNNSSTSTVFPDLPPWVPPKPKKLHKPAKGKRASRGPDIGRYAVAFAVGFTLVGAGLILGWSVGWLLPTF